MGGTSFDTFETRLTCPKCKKDTLHPIRQAIADDSVPCRFCGDLIDLTDAETRIRLEKEAEAHKRIWKEVK